MSESDDSSFSKMDVKDKKNCRACTLSGGIFEAGNVSINEVGYGNLTFQEMFERSIGYQIMPNEPQYFCQNCAQNLIQWYEFREVCNETQIFFSKSSYKIYNETIWFDADAQKSQINVKLEDDTDIKVVNHRVSSAAALNDYDLTKTVTFKVCLKNYPLSHGSSIGHITVKWTNQSEFYKQIWDSVKGQLRRKIIFVDNGLRPVWHENVPSESDLNDFVQVGDPIGKKSFSLNTICEISKKHLKKWETNYPSLYIYPYSNNVSSKPLWSIAEAALLKNDQSMAEELIKIEFEKLKLLQSINDLKVNKLSKQRKTPKPQKLVAPPEVLEIKDCSMPENTSNYKYAITFEAFNRKFKTQELKNRFIGNFTIGANHLAEFKHNLWKILTPIIDREIVFDLNETPMWSTKEHPTVDEIEKFVEFSDRRGKRRYELKHITEMVLETWNDTEDNIISMNIYPYTSNISTKASWLKAKKLFDPPAVDSENMEPQSQTVNEPSFDSDISSLVNKLKKVHKHVFPLATDRAWKMWAHYINSYAEIFHEKFVNEKPPTQLLPFFEANLEIVANPWWTKSCPPLISFSAFIRLKEGVKLQQSFLLGECEFMGDTIEEIKHSIWEKVRPYLFREIIFEDGIPKWSSKVTPTEEDLDKFVYINIIGERKIMKLDCFLKSFLDSWASKNDISLDIYQFSDSISTYTKYEFAKSLLFVYNSKAKKETIKIVQKLKNIHERQIVSLDLNWKMWAYFIQGHEISEEDSLIKEKPPTKLSHLFGSVDIQNDMTNRLEMLRKSNDKSDGEEEEKDPDPNVYAFDVDEVLQLTEEEKKNQNSIMKKCPFVGCTVMLVIIKLKKHMFICRFNPHVTGRYKCRYDGCSKTFKYKYRIKNHLLLCRFNPNRVQAPLRQCPYCPVITTSLNAHIYHHHSGGQYICDICGAVKSSKGYLKRHIIYAHQSVEFKCSDCSVVFKTAKSLKNHMLRGHSDIPLELKYKCNECSYKTYSEANFNRHIKYKHDPNGKTIICPDCGKAFGKPSEMKIHSLTHNQDKKFTCDVCSHVCTTAIALKCHKTLHEEWKYECPVCGLKRRSTYEVRMHCGRKHPDYKLPPKGTIMKLTSRLHGRRHYIYSDDEESK